MRRKVKSWLSALLAGALALGCLTGCSNNNSTTTTAAPQQGTAAPTQGETPEATPEATVPTEPITISILTTRHSGATNDAEDIWFFQYLEYWLAQQGYDVTIDVQQTMEPDQQISLKLGTDTLPDLIWGPELKASDAVVYGESEGMLLDWSPYINEETMPNFWRELQYDMDALAASTCSNGAVYSIPKLSEKLYGDASLCYGMSDRMFVNEKWLKQLNLSMPTNIDQFLDMLRAFKNDIKLEGDQEVIPMLDSNFWLPKFLWTGLGYYGSTNSYAETYGIEIAIKDGEITMGAYNKDDYKTFIEIMKTCYDEGLISKDYFTMDGTTRKGLVAAGVNGVNADWTLGGLPDFHDWVGLSPFAIGDNDEVAISITPSYAVGSLWASAKTEHPEILAKIVDYLFSVEGALLYEYGPQKGQDPLNMLDGWYVNADGTDATVKLIEDGVYASMNDYIIQHIHSSDGIGKNALARTEMKRIAGIKEMNEPYVLKDVITGKDLVGTMKNDYTQDDAGHRWRTENTKASKDFVTSVSLPIVYMTEEDALNATDMRIVLEEHIKAESAKFITGARPLSELDAFHEELKAMDIEEYINIYKEAYSTYMASVFEK